MYFLIDGSFVLVGNIFFLICLVRLFVIVLDRLVFVCCFIGIFCWVGLLLWVWLRDCLCCLYFFNGYSVIIIWLFIVCCKY